MTTPDGSVASVPVASVPVASVPVASVPVALRAALHAPVLGWYAGSARDLPWRDPAASPWAVFVSEVMLQQTPVARVEPVWRAWLERWPTPADLAAEPAGEAIRAWGRLGYPRRALRLHAAAVAMVERHGGNVPGTCGELRDLPGVGGYTAAAVAAFAFGERTAVVDTNVRRVLARVVSGVASAAPSLTAPEVARAAQLLPDDPPTARVWNVAVMELGSLVCTARAPRCGDCPVASRCVWLRAGRPPSQGPRRPGQAWHGTDRQARGALLAVLREATGAVSRPALAVAWPDDQQRERCLDSLVADGLVQALPRSRFRLPA